MSEATHSEEREHLLRQAMGQVQGAMTLYVAYIGIVNGLLGALARSGAASAQRLAAQTDTDGAYVARWCDSAYAFRLLDEPRPGTFCLSHLGELFRPEGPGTLMPAAVQSVLAAHMAERAAGLMRSGERPGEGVLAERETLLPWFGPMLEHHFGPLLETDILPKVPAFARVDQHGGIAVDLGCGNGWYLRRLARRYSRMRGIGIDGFAANIHQARETAEAEGVGARLDFRQGDLHQIEITEPVDLIAMNRALHHVWDQKQSVFQILERHLKPGGFAVIWEPNWPVERHRLREAGYPPMAFQNLAEHVQGNRFLSPKEIVTEFRALGMAAQVYLFADGREAVIQGTKPA